MNHHLLIHCSGVIVMNTSPLIGTSIFLYIVAFIAVMIIAGYFTYHISPSRKKRREEKRNNRR